MISYSMEIRIVLDPVFPERPAIANNLFEQGQGTFRVTEMAVDARRIVETNRILIFGRMSAGFNNLTAPKAHHSMIVLAQVSPPPNTTMRT